MAVTGDTMTGTLRLPWKWNSTDITANTFYVKGNSDQDGFAFGVGTGVSSWFSWDNTTGLRRAIDVWNDASNIKLGEGGHDVEIANDLYVPNYIFHTGDTNTYMQFHATDQWRVVTGGSERLEVNNTQVSISNNLVVTGTVSGSNLNVSNWNTAYGWGNHASAGYSTATGVANNADNYGSWNLKTNDTQRTTVGSGGDLNLVAGTNVSLSYSAGGTVTITSTDTNTQLTDAQVRGKISGTGLISYNSSTGVISTTANNYSLPPLVVELPAGRL